MIWVHLASPHACRSIFLEPQVVFTEDLSTQLSEVKPFLLSWWFSLPLLWDRLISRGWSVGRWGWAPWLWTDWWQLEIEAWCLLAMLIMAVACWIWSETQVVSSPDAPATGCLGPHMYVWHVTWPVGTQPGTPLCRPRRWWASGGSAVFCLHLQQAGSWLPGAISLIARPFPSLPIFWGLIGNHREPRNFFPSNLGRFRCLVGPYSLHPSISSFLLRPSLQVTSEPVLLRNSPRGCHGQHIERGIGHCLPSSLPDLSFRSSPAASHFSWWRPPVQASAEPCCGCGAGVAIIWLFFHWTWCYRIYSPLSSAMSHFHETQHFHPLLERRTVPKYQDIKLPRCKICIQGMLHIRVPIVSLPTGFTISSILEWSP